MGILTSLKNLRPIKGGVLVAVLAFMPNLFTHAQTSPCTPDCPNSSWNGPHTITLNDWTYKGIEIECKVEVTYWARIACGTFNDLQITDVNIINGAGCPFDVNNQTAAIEVLHKKLIRKNPQPPLPPSFDHPSAGNCNSNWRVTNGSCWRNVEGGFEPCDASDDRYCLTSYEVCRDDCGNLTVEKTGVQGSGNCASEACDFVCE